MSNATAATVGGWPVLNPFASSVFLPPRTAYQEDIERYILVGTSGAFIWDLLSNIRRDCIFVARHTRLHLPTIVYFFSKLSSLAFVIFAATFQTAPLSNCTYSAKAVSVLFSFALPSTALLFFFRARAVFGMNPFAVAFFGVLWLGLLAGCLTTIPGIDSVNIGPTPYCTFGGVRLFTVGGVITPLIHDSIVFFAISWRLWHNTWANRTIKNGVRSMVFGDYLPSFSKSLLQDGQVYFLTTVTANLLTVIMAYSDSLPDSYRMMFAVPNAALVNIMACRVYRKTLLGSPKEKQRSSNSHPTTDDLTVNVSKTVESMV